MTTTQWNELVFLFSDLRDTERNHKTRTLGKERSAAVADALDVLMREARGKIECDRLFRGGVFRPIEEDLQMTPEP